MTDETTEADSREAFLKFFGATPASTSPLETAWICWQAGRQALAPGGEKPVAWRYTFHGTERVTNDSGVVDICEDMGVTCHPLYAAPVAAPGDERDARDAKSDAEIDDLLGEANRGFNIERDDYFKAFRDAEAAHGIPTAPAQGGKGAG